MIQYNIYEYTANELFIWNLVVRDRTRTRWYRFSHSVVARISLYDLKLPQQREWTQKRPWLVSVSSCNEQTKRLGNSSSISITFSIKVSIFSSTFLYFFINFSTLSLYIIFIDYSYRALKNNNFSVEMMR